MVLNIKKGNLVKSPKSEGNYERTVYSVIQSLPLLAKEKKKGISLKLVKRAKILLLGYFTISLATGNYKKLRGYYYTKVYTI